MDHVSEFFKKGFLSLHKNKIEKNYQQKTLRDRMDNFNNMRKETRSTLIFQKRNIDVNMTPINTPEPSKTIKKAVENKQNKGTNKRLEMLKNWKAEKEKKKEQAKQKAKPVFKVYHVPVEVGLPDLEKVNKAIKGKPISQFAPAEHKFHAPKNVKPIALNNCSSNSVLGKSNKNKNTSKNPTEKDTSQLQNTRLTRSRKENMKSEKSNVSTHTHSFTVDATRKNIVKKVSEQSSNPNTRKQKKTEHLQENSKPSSTLKPKVVDTRTEKKNNSNSTRTTNTKLTRKCSLPKKSKKDDHQTKTENVNNSTTNTGTIKERLKEDKKHIDINTPIVNVRKTPKKCKIKFKEGCDPTVGDNEKQINTIKIQDKRNKNTPSKTPTKSRKSTGYTSTRNVGWDVVEVMDSDDEILSKDVNHVTPKASSIKYKKTPRRSHRPSVCDDTHTEQISEAVDVEEPRERHSTPATPKNRKSNNFPTSPVYISPFVTISRGKTSARKEYQVRKSPDAVLGTPEFSKSISESTSPKAGAAYFSRKLNNEIEKIQVMCKQWNSYREENSVPEEANDMIDVAIGQSNLLLSKKFQQFQSLIDQCRKFEYIEKPITCEDLHGFWDMIYMQVVDLDKRFQNLENLKANNWEEIMPVKKPVIKRGRGRPKKAAPKSSLRDLIKAARQKKKSNSDDATQTTDLKPDDNVFAEGSCSVKSPVRKDNPQPSPLVRRSSTRRSLRVSLLAHQTRNRISSPGLTMMKISQAIKRGDGLTPSKSILKSELPKSATRITKSVLFKDDLEEDIDKKWNSMKSLSLTNMDMDKENDANEVNLITFSPQIKRSPRRSHRLAKLN